MYKSAFLYALTCLAMIPSFAQEAEVPLSTFDVKATTDIHYPVGASEIEVTWVERRESTLYITRELKAEILDEVSVEDEIEQKGYSFLIYRDTAYWLIRIKPLERYKYGVYELRELTGSESPIAEYNHLFSEYLRQQMVVIDQLGDRGDLLGAAKLTNYVIDKSQDSLITAEALYKLIGISRQVAERINKRRDAITVMGKFNFQTKNYKHTEQLGSQELFLGSRDRAEMALFQAEGITLGIAKWSNHYVSDHYKTLEELALNYAGTRWGELAALTRLTDDGNGSGLSTFGEEAMERAYAFLERYPESEYLPSVYSVLGRVYSDELRLRDCDERHESVKELREKSIKYFLLAAEGTVTKVVQDLQAGKCPANFYLFSD